MLNQGRRNTSPSVYIPSSPPAAIEYDREADGSFEARDVPSPAQTLWTAHPSPTQTLGYSSPELPALANLSVLSSNPRTPSTVARQDNFNDNTSYYTASWGSPYRIPPPLFNNRRQNNAANLESDDAEEDLSSLSFGLEHLLPRPLEEDSPGRFNLDHLLPQPLDQDQSPNQFSLDHLIPSRLRIPDTPTKVGASSELTPRPVSSNISNPSAEWLKQVLDSRWNPEASNWLSDSTAESDSGHKSGDNQKLPTEQFRKKNNRVRQNNKTLNQQDFWSHFSKGQREEIGKMMASRYANPAVNVRQDLSAGSWRSNTGRNMPAEKPTSPQETHAPELPEVQSQAPVQLPAPIEPVPPPRPRKKILVKGKGCIISIPRDIPRGTPGYPPKPMNAAAVEAKIQQLERAGYSTRGYGHWNAHDGPVTLTTQNRDIWPDETEIRVDRATGSRVHIPKKAEWDEYMNHLLELKLAALGVSQGGGDEDTTLSRQPSANHPGMPFSPPLPTPSAGSHPRMRQGSIVSGSFPLGPSPGHMSRQSIASPLSTFGNARGGMHMHRQSMFASPAGFMHHAASPSGTWSPGGYFPSQGARGASPALPLSRPDLANVVSPVSPFGAFPNQSLPLTPVQQEDLLVQMQHRQQQLQAQLFQQQQQQVLGLRPSSTLAEVPEDEAEEDELPQMQHAHQSAADIAVPSPLRGHRHNISANLEREARDAEYHLEEAIDKQFDEGGDFSTEPEITPKELKPSNPMTNSTWEESRPTLHQPQPHNRAHSLAQSQAFSFNFGPQQQENSRGHGDGAKSDVSDVTNPSFEDGQHGPATGSAQHSKSPSQVSNSWKDSKFAFAKPGSAMHSKHTSRSSTSKLNVEAKEFKFNPSASFSPSVGSGSFSPATQHNGFSAPPQSNKPSIEGLSGFSVSAPTFKPNAPVFKPSVPAFKPAAGAPAFKPTINGLGMPTSGFNFASSGPSFKPDAPAFEPGSSVPKPSQPVTAPTNFSSKIFGDVSISTDDMVKPAKRSKAIPIMRPDATGQTPERATKEEEDQEDEEGRPMQAEGREKRARRGRTDGNDVPKFATQPVLLSQPLGENKQPQAPKQDSHFEREVLSEDKENMSPNAERAPSKSKSPEPLPMQREVPAVETRIPTPSTEKSTEIVSRTQTPIDDRTPHQSDSDTPTVEEAQEASAKHGHKSSLSAAAKPFEFRPQFGTSGYDFGVHITKPSHSQSEELNEHVGPARNASGSPATTFRPSDDGSFRTALESGRHMPYTESESIDFDPSFNDIDAVMKHMNDGGSDFGVERDDHTWEQSSQRLSIHDFQRTDLAPNTNLRSDAPSPSPRRLYALRNNLRDSTSINQDPFDDERAAYHSPVRRLNNAEEVPMSDWDEGILSEDDTKIQTRSRFFDNHVDDLLSRLLQSRLGPMEKNLQGIEDAIAMMTQRTGRGQRRVSTNEPLDSDADDEDEEIGTDSHYRNRSPRQDRRMEKIRSIVKEALEAHQPAVTSLPVPVPEPIIPEKIRDAVVEALAAHQPQAHAEHLNAEGVRDVIMEALAHHQPQKDEHVPADQIRAIVEEAIISHQPVVPVVESIKPNDIRSIVAELLATHIPQALAPTVEPIQPEQIRSIVSEVVAAHAPPPAPAAEPIRPEDIRSIMGELLAAQVPASEPIQPDALRSIVAEVFASHQPRGPPGPIPEIVEPDMIRSIVEEALRTHQPAPSPLAAPIDIPQPQFDISEIYQVIGSLKASIAQTTSNHLQAEDFRELIDDAFMRQSMEFAKREEIRAIEEKDARIADLEAKLQDATLGLEAEAETRKALELRETDTARLLRVTEEELTLFKVAASDDENKIRALKDEQEGVLRSLDAFRNDSDALQRKLTTLEAENDELRAQSLAFESSEDDTKRKLDAVTAENEALTFTLEEHRMSSNKWRNDIQRAHEQTEKMRKAIEHSHLQAQEATRVREAMRAKFEKLQQNMVIASGQAATERAQWQKSDEAHMKKYEVLSARIEAEGRTRERLERELERLETQERESMKLRVTLEQTQKHNVRLEETVEKLKEESYGHQTNAARFEREFKEAREAGHAEIRRTRVLMEADIDAANNQVNIVRADLDAEIARVRAELDNVRMDADTAKAKHELDLEAASDAKKHAVNEVIAGNQHALQEQQQAFERRLESLAKEHVRVLEMAREDKDRADAFHKEKLSLADSKMELLQDKMSLLEEKLSIAKEAASAAAAAAQSTKTLPATDTTVALPTGAPEKISPQALRESISVLQEQLQERETRIEALEHDLSEVDTEAPAKLKERDTEIGWLRELLGVRIDDLNDLINALAQPTFNRESVRDAAIRIRTNLQMEQQEKERLVQGGQSFPTLATLSNFASPKAVQFAAAFGNWRKGRESASSALAGSSVGTSRNQTPSRSNPPSASSFLSGLMTPPTSNLRRTPDLPSTTRPQNPRSNSASSRGSDAGFASLGKQPVPSTPPLLRKGSYDNDAEDGRFSENGFYDDDSTVDGDVTPIGLNFGNELRR
jgi:hypothetical protein